MHPNQQHGNHTWDLILHYYCCPKCQYVMESREKFERVEGQLKKNLICPRCQQGFTVAKKIKKTFGPLLGHNPEINE